MKNTYLRKVALIPFIFVSACAVAPDSFYSDPQGVGESALCRAYLGDGDASFKRDVSKEMSRRGLTKSDCESKVTSQNVALAIVGVAATATAVAVHCSNNNCGGGGGSSRGLDYDCEGGGGDGPLYIKGPVSVPHNDPYDLDRDGNGIGCETYDISSGS